MPFLYVLCPQPNLLNPLPPPNKIPGYATGTESDFTRTFAPWIGGNQASEVPVFWLIIDGNLEEKIHSLYYIYLYISPFCLSSTEFVGTPPPSRTKFLGTPLYLQVLPVRRPHQQHHTLSVSDRGWQYLFRMCIFHFSGLWYLKQKLKDSSEFIWTRAGVAASNKL